MAGFLRQSEQAGWGKRDETEVRDDAAHAALDDIERARPAVGWYLACFNKHRDAIEQVANVKHQRGECEESGAVIVQGGDLKSLGP